MERLRCAKEEIEEKERLVELREREGSKEEEKKKSKEKSNKGRESRAG